MSEITISNPWAFVDDATREACLAALIAGDPTALSTIAGTSLDLNSTHNLRYLKFTSNSAVTVTVQDDATGPFTGSERIFLIQYGEGPLTVVADPGVNVRCASAMTTRSRYSTACLARIGANEWLLFGDLVAYVPLDSPEW